LLLVSLSKRQVCPVFFVVFFIFMVDPTKAYLSQVRRFFGGYGQTVAIERCRLDHGRFAASGQSHRRDAQQQESDRFHGYSSQSIPGNFNDWLRREEELLISRRI
jgi:hypothetical protein